MNDNIIISLNRERFDLDWMACRIHFSHWGGWIPISKIKVALENSLLFGAFDITKGARKENMVGFLRVVTDRASFSSITDVIVTPEYQRRGIGTMLLKRAVSHYWVNGTICVLHANPHLTKFYENAGFKVEKNGIMMRVPV